jgi:hypothetical protein
MQNESQEIDCIEHGKGISSCVCGHLVENNSVPLGFIENSSVPGDLQA